MKLLNFLRGEAFARGVHPPQHKDTAAMPISRLPFAAQLVVPLSQNVGRPARPVVQVGQEVLRGQPLAEADGFVSAPHHAPASGVVEAIRLHPTSGGPWTDSVIVKVHPGSTQAVEWEEPQDLSAMDADQLIAAVQRTGIVGLGGGVFPTHAKLRVPKEFPVDTLVVNGCECEPYLTSDHRIMVERAADILAGVAISRRLLGNPRAIIGIEDNKPDAAAAIRAVLPFGGDVTVETVPTKYPQGAGEMLIKTLLGREVPPNSRSYQVGAYVQNVATLASMGALMPRGRGFIERADHRGRHSGGAARQLPRADGHAAPLPAGACGRAGRFGRSDLRRPDDGAGGGLPRCADHQGRVGHSGVPRAGPCPARRAEKLSLHQMRQVYRKLPDGVEPVHAGHAGRQAAIRSHGRCLSA